MQRFLLSEKYKKAQELVAVLFKDEKRKISGVPYIVHLTGVCYIVAKLTDDEELHIAALLHDVLEDIPGSIYSEEQMTKEFGEKISSIVKSVSHFDEQDGYKGSRQKYLIQIQTASKESSIISGADLLYNLYDSIDSFENFPEQSISLFTGEKSQIRKDFYEKRLAVIESKLGSKNQLVIELKEAMKQFKSFYRKTNVK